MAFGKRYYLKIDPALPSPAVWVSEIKDATSFRIEREAQAIKGQLQDASAVMKGAGELDSNTPQTPGMTRAAAITYARSGATRLWAGTVVVQPHAKTGPHHHGELEAVIYIARGRARMRWGDRLEFCDEAEPGDFIYVPPYVPHQEINARPDMPCEAVIVRSGQKPVVVNLDIESPEPLSESNDERPFHPSR